MSTWFISDLHLSADHPAITAGFLALLQQAQSGVDALYILGDLFDYWIGDDDPAPHLTPIIQGLRELSARIPCYFMAGNRDFLVGTAFCKKTGLILLPDPTVIDLYGTKMLLVHGDSLCTDDAEYLAYRAKVRDPKTMRRFLRLPLWIRRLIASWMRAASKKRIAGKSAMQLTTNENALLTLMREHHVTALIHGHIHQAGIHRVDDHGVMREWFVLGDWSDQAGCLLKCAKTGEKVLEDWELAKQWQKLKPIEPLE